LIIIQPIASTRQGGDGLDGISRARLRIAPDQPAIRVKRRDGGRCRAGNPKKRVPWAVVGLMPASNTSTNSRAWNFCFTLNSWLAFGFRGG